MTVVVPPQPAVGKAGVFVSISEPVKVHPTAIHEVTEVQY